MNEPLTITYTLSAPVGRRDITETITIQGQCDDIESVRGELEKLRDVAFKASFGEDILMELRSHQREVEKNLYQAQKALDVARHEWGKAKDFMTAQGLAKTLPEFPAVVDLPGLPHHEF